MNGGDFGSGTDGGKLVLWGANGRIPAPPRVRGMSDADYFPYVVKKMLEIDDFTIESPTIGSSGAERDDIFDIVEDAPHKAFTLPARAVKNFLGRKPESDEEAAATIYLLATDGVTHLKLVARPSEAPLRRNHRSVRPWDKRGYKGEHVEEWLARLVDANLLSDSALSLFATVKSPVRNPHWEYVRAATLPFAMALTESIADTRDGYEKVIGLYAHGYPSFYRRATVSLMQKAAKAIVNERNERNGTPLLNEKTGKVRSVRNAETTRADRKEAWRQVRRAIRELYGKSTQGISNPTEGTV